MLGLAEWIILIIVLVFTTLMLIALVSYVVNLFRNPRSANRKRGRARAKADRRGA